MCQRVKRVESQRDLLVVLNISGSRWGPEGRAPLGDEPPAEGPFSLQVTPSSRQELEAEFQRSKTSFCESGNRVPFSADSEVYFLL